jgi:protoheme IX farnesyltransferase
VKKHTVENTVESRSLIASKVNDYGQLVKFKLSLTVVFSAVMAFLIASAGQFTWHGLFYLAFGGFLITGAANTLNQVLERDFDKLMKRTEDRPLARGRMSVSEAVLFAGFSSFAGIVFLALFNPWVPLLGMLSLVSYAFVYTPLKRLSPIAVLVGAIPGALPMAIGVVAAQGEVTGLAIALFALQFFWQFPHFWAIAWLGHEDYSRAGFHLLPGKELGSHVGWQAFLYALMIMPVVGLMWGFGLTGSLAASLLGLASLAYAHRAWNLYKRCDRNSARGLMFASLVYLPTVLAILAVEAYVL